MKKRFTLATAFLFACSALLFGQNTFTKTYGLPPSYEGLEDIVEANGQYYGLGSRYSPTAKNLDIRQLPAGTYFLSCTVDGTWCSWQWVKR